MMSVSTFSQNGYPKRIVLGSDTVIAITLQQMDKINDYKIVADGLTEENESLRDVIVDRDNALFQSDSIRTELKGQMLHYKSLVDVKDDEIGLLNENAEDLEEIITLNKKRCRRQKLTMIISSVAGGVLIGGLVFGL